MLLDDLQVYKNAILNLGKQYGARNIRVFGSVARGEEPADSDVDFLVDFPLAYDLFSQRLPFTMALEHLLGRKVDVLPEHEMSRHIRAQVLKEAVKI